MFKVYVQNWYKHNPDCPGGIEPDGQAHKHTLGKFSTEEAAQKVCKEYNATHPGGKLHRGAHYTEIK